MIESPVIFYGITRIFSQSFIEDIDTNTQTKCRSPQTTYKDKLLVFLNIHSSF